MKCLILLTFMMLLASCSSDVSSVENEASSERGGNISGLSQKGPVLAGASVVVQELDSVTLLQTGKSFKGMVVNDNGEFVVENVNTLSGTIGRREVAAMIMILVMMMVFMSF